MLEEATSGPCLPRGLALNRGLVALAFVLGAIGANHDSAGALPSGRSWAPSRQVLIPGIVRVRAPRFEVDSTGNPILIIGAQREGMTDKEWSVFGWRDSVWTPRVFTGVRASFIPEPVLSLIPGQYLVWISNVAYPSGFGPLLFSKLLPSPSPVETVLTTFIQDSEYGAAVSGQRRWVARSQQKPGTFTNWIRVLYSDTVGVWRELPEVGANDLMCTIAPLSERSAIVAYSDGTGLNWAIAEGNQWTRSGNLDPGGSLHPRFRLRPSGGLWLMWADRFSVHMSSFRDGVWDHGDSLTCVHPPGETFWSAWSDMSRDPGERPVLAWGDLGVDRTFYDVGCVAFPTDSGWMPGEEIPGSRGLFVTPKVTRDRNGDAWLVWDMKGVDMTRYTHTYVSATASTPTIVGAGRRRVVHWTLSEPAPESWWAVMRARRGGGFEQVARVRAAGGVDMSWADDSPPAGHIRYKIRRENVNTTYEWVSREAHWPPKAKGPPLRLAVAAPARPGETATPPARLELEGAAAGPIDLALYDLQGRLVLRQRADASGSGEDSIRLDYSSASPPLTPGIYFVIARDAADRRSDTVKLMVLR